MASKQNPTLSAQPASGSPFVIWRSMSDIRDRGRGRIFNLIDEHGGYHDQQQDADKRRGYRKIPPVDFNLSLKAISIKPSASLGDCRYGYVGRGQQEA